MYFDELTLLAANKALLFITNQSFSKLHNGLERQNSCRAKALCKRAKVSKNIRFGFSQSIVLVDKVRLP